MYTGIIEHLGEIIALAQAENSMRLTIASNFKEIIEGESIALDGICVTACEPDNNIFSCDLSPETLQLTTAHYFFQGQKINLERSLRLGDRLGGHFVMGHVDTTAKIIQMETENHFTKMRIGGLAKEHMPFLVHKGSVAVNGISLTINAVGEDYFELMIIPHTLEQTNLHYLKTGAEVNIEFDTITRTVVRQLELISNQ